MAPSGFAIDWYNWVFFFYNQLVSRLKITWHKKEKQAENLDIEVSFLKWKKEKEERQNDLYLNNLTWNILC